MPYILNEDRKKLAYRGKEHPENAGELNYILTVLVHTYMKNKGIKYQHFNDVVSAITRNIIGAVLDCGDDLYTELRFHGFKKPRNSNELSICIRYFTQQYREDKVFTNEAEDDILGALECCKLELYRRFAAPYEDTKVISNGDVNEMGTK